MVRKTNKWSVVANATDAQSKIRISYEMRETLKERAVQNGRTFNNEVLVRLAKTLTEEER